MPTHPYPLSRGEINFQSEVELIPFQGRARVGLNEGTMMRKIIPYKHELVKKARELRNNATLSERMLWKYLKRKQL
ncbi:MAG: hypothetical protein KDB98_14365, partial [Flavobacteriales bacterium]|nr:hypothetical protein [Flavobacteriales bacterium]